MTYEISDLEYYIIIYPDGIKMLKHCWGIMISYSSTYSAILTFSLLK